MKIRDATQILAMLERGEFATAVTEKLQEVIDACRDAATPKVTSKGSITIKLNVEVQGVQITFYGEVDGKTPKVARGSSIYFLAPDGSISTEHPQQMDMFPQAAERMTREA